MRKNEVTLEDLERLAAAMAQKIPDLDCPACCDCDWVYQYVEKSAQLYTEEREWALFSNTVVGHHIRKKSKGLGSGPG